MRWRERGSLLEMCMGCDQTEDRLLGRNTLQNEAAVRFHCVGRKEHCHLSRAHSNLLHALGERLQSADEIDRAARSGAFQSSRKVGAQRHLCRKESTSPISTVPKLHQGDTPIAQGRSTAMAERTIAVSEHCYSRWCTEYGSLCPDQQTLLLSPDDGLP
jgi:hypothetical protein